MQRILKWRKWQDPFRPILDENIPDESWDSKNYKSLEGKDLGPCIVGPMGLIPIRESNCPGKIYNFWVGHTNFDLEEREVKKICKAIGVQAFTLYDRYSFRIAIGKVFNGKSVRKAIEAILCQEPPKKEPEKATSESGLVRLINLARKNYHWWAIVKIKGKLTVISGISREDVEAKVNGEVVASSWSS